MNTKDIIIKQISNEVIIKNIYNILKEPLLKKKLIILLELFDLEVSNKTPNSQAIPRDPIINDKIKPENKTKLSRLQSKMLKFGYKVGSVFNIKGGHFEITKDLGMTSDALLFQGINKKTNDKVFIKMQPVDIKTSYQIPDESHIMTLLKNGGCSEYSQDLISYGDLKTEKGTMYVLITPLYGNDLTTFKLKTSQTKQIKEISKQLMSVLKSIHRCGIVHRDIKPGNIVWTDQNEKEVKLIDFGLSKDLYLSGKRESKIQPPEGTPAHKSTMMHKEEIKKYEYPKTFMDDIQGMCWTILDIVGGITWIDIDLNRSKDDILKHILDEKLKFIEQKHDDKVHQVLQKIIIFTRDNVEEEKKYFHLNKKDFFDQYLNNVYVKIDDMLNDIDKGLKFKKKK